MRNQDSTIPFSDLARGSFVSRINVPMAGIALEGEIAYARSDFRVASEVGPWLVDGIDNGEKRWVRVRAALYHTDLHRRFARLNSQDRILKFANRFGHLGVEKVRVLKMTEGGGGSATNRIAERLKHWQDEVKRMGLLLALWDLAAVESVSELRHYIEWSDNPRRVGLRFLWSNRGGGRLVPATGATFLEGKARAASGELVPYCDTRTIASAIIWEDSEALTLWKDGEIIRPARYYVAREINKQLRGRINPTLLPFGENRLYFQPESLIGALYVLFALEVSGEGGKERVACPQCTELFEVSRKGQRYCSPSCRSLAHYHRQRAKSKAKPSR